MACILEKVGIKMPLQAVLTLQRDLRPAYSDFQAAVTLVGSNPAMCRTFLATLH